MEDKITEILELLKENDDNSKREILLECASQIGSEKWANEVKNLMQRMGDIDKK